MPTQRIVEPTTARDSNPAAAVIAALLVALLIGVGIYFFAHRDNSSGSNNPQPQTTQQGNQTSSPQPTTPETSAPASSAPSSQPTATSTP